MDNFETAVRRAEKDKGYIIGFSFTKGAYEEAARARGEGLEIALIELEALFAAGRDVTPRPAATQMEQDLFHAVRLAAAELGRTAPGPKPTAEELDASVRGRSPSTV